MDLQTYRTHINQLDEGIAALLVQRSEYPLNCMVSDETPDSGFCKTLLQRICPKGKVSAEDLEGVSEMECVLKAALEIRFGYAKPITDYKKTAGLEIEDRKREEEIINRAGAYAASKGKDPEPHKGAFELIIDRMKDLQREYADAPVWDST